MLYELLFIVFGEHMHFMELNFLLFYGYVCLINDVNVDHIVIRKHNLAMKKIENEKLSQMIAFLLKFKIENSEICIFV